jgi:hypothetical protein
MAPLIPFDSTACGKNTQPAGIFQANLHARGHSRGLIERGDLAPFSPSEALLTSHCPN